MAASSVVKAAPVPANIPFACPQTQVDAALFLRKHEKIIAKPIAGSGAQAIHIITAGPELQSLDITKYILPLQLTSYSASVWDPAQVSTAIQVAHILALTFAAIDYLVDDAGRAHILEVNTAPDLQWFHAPTSGPAVDVAGQFLEAVFPDNLEKYNCQGCEQRSA